MANASLISVKFQHLSILSRKHARLREIGYAQKNVYYSLIILRNRSVCQPRSTIHEKAFSRQHALSNAWDKKNAITRHKIRYLFEIFSPESSGIEKSKMCGAKREPCSNPLSGRAVRD